LQLSQSDLNKHFECCEIPKPESLSKQELAEILHTYYTKDVEENKRLNASNNTNPDPRSTLGAQLSLMRLGAALTGNDVRFGERDNVEEEDSAEYGMAPSISNQSNMRIVRRPLTIVSSGENSSNDFRMEPFDRVFPVSDNLRSISNDASGGDGTGTGSMSRPPLGVNRTFILRSNGSGGNAVAVPFMARDESTMMNSSSGDVMVLPISRQTLTPASSNNSAVVSLQSGMPAESNADQMS